VISHEGARVYYDKLLLTTGAAPRRLDLPGAELAGVHYLRTMADSLALREAIAPGGRRVVVIGGGWIGLECAAAAREYGNEVTIVELLSTPLYQMVGPELGTVFAELHRGHGVELLTEESAAQILGAGGRVSAVMTASGRELPADAVVIGIGAVPNVGVAIDAGLEVDNGVLVDSSLRTADPDIFAAGDLANAEHPLFGRRIRVEHWANALHGGPAAARSMLGRPVVYDRVPYFFTDQYELGMEFSGLADEGGYDEVVFRGDVEALEFIAFWLSAGRVVAGMNVNVWDVTDAIQALIRSGEPVDTARLTDPAMPLSGLI
jgi:3-phenylpropionate/trans-cinnamate dioxygenase ferredoxin reductase subunit